MRFSWITIGGTAYVFFATNLGKQKSRPCAQGRLTYNGTPSGDIFSKSKSAFLLTSFVLERKTRLELATPTLARLCSTN